MKNPYVIGFKDCVSSFLYEDGYIIITRYNNNGEFISSSIEQKTVLAANKLQYDVVSDSQGNEIPLYRYEYPGGVTLYEEYQVFSYQGEDYLFCAFKDVDGDWIPESLWTKEEMLDNIMENISTVN